MQLKHSTDHIIVIVILLLMHLISGCSTDRLMPDLDGSGHVDPHFEDPTGKSDDLSKSVQAGETLTPPED